MSAIISNCVQQTQQTGVEEMRNGTITSNFVEQSHVAEDENMYASNGYDENEWSAAQFQTQHQREATHPVDQSEINDVPIADNMDGSPSEAAKPILAERFKTKMCKNFVTTGACPYTNHCMFAHGEEELRTCEDNIRDGLTTENAIKAFHHQEATRLRMMMRLYSGKNSSKAFNSNNNNHNNNNNTELQHQQQQSSCTCCCHCAAKQMNNEIPVSSLTAFESAPYLQQEFIMPYQQQSYVNSMPTDNVYNENSNVYYNYENMNTNNVNSNSLNYVEQEPDQSFQTAQEAVQHFTQYAPKRIYAHNPYANNLLESEDERNSDNQYQASQSTGCNYNIYPDQEYVNTDSNNYTNNKNYYYNNSNNSDIAATCISRPVENSYMNESQEVTIEQENYFPETEMRPIAMNSIVAEAKSLRQPCYQANNSSNATSDFAKINARSVSYVCDERSSVMVAKRKLLKKAKTIAYCRPSCRVESDNDDEDINSSGIVDINRKSKRLMALEP